VPEPMPITIPAHQNFAEQLATIILQQAAKQLPDLSQFHIIIPNAFAAHQLRLALNQKSETCLLGPYIGSLPQWMNEKVSLPNSQTGLINPQAKKLLLLDALKQHPDLFNPENTWQVCESLLTLFDELTDYDSSFLETDKAQWIDKLSQCYNSQVDIQHLNNEANIVFQLWQAWLKQMSDMNIIDSASSYQQQLKHSPKHIGKDDYFFIAGKDELKPAELEWCLQLENKNQLCFVSQDISLDTSNQYLSYFLDACFNHETPLYNRINTVKKEELKNFNYFDAKNPEQEARAIDLKIRILLAEGKNNIAIATEDRKLARRVRALLERSGILIQDTAGWSLSTTSSATIIERWLECIEQDFDHQPFLDLLKSPFFYANNNKETHLNQIHRLEQDIILHENIARDIKRYIHGMSLREDRLTHWPEKHYKNLKQLLHSVEQASSSLQTLYNENTLQPPEKYLQHLITSLQDLGIYQRLEEDVAGQCIINVLNNMQQGLKLAAPEMNWQDFRVWLGSSLEQEEFTPQNQPSAVQLMNLKQAQYCQFDALIIAGANKETLPGSTSQNPFFNQSVRSSLKLPNWHDDKHIVFQRFRCLLESSDHILISFCSENNGEWQQPSPWLTSIIDFSKLGLNIDLQDNRLLNLLQNPDTEINECDISSTPKTAQTPSPKLDDSLIPLEYSASRHQRLINCPYQFFSADVLALRASEKITEELMKSDFGEKVHLILQAFHNQVTNLIAPFVEPLDKNNREQALQHMIKLSTQVFKINTEDNVQHRNWLQRWLRIAPQYIDWQIQRQTEWNIYALEQKKNVNISDSVSIKGRLDRVDEKNNHYSIIDYKTGTSAKQDKVNSGEDVQLISYASMLEQVNEVAYFELGKDKSRITSSLKDEHLNELKELSEQRLVKVIDQLKQGTSLNAWGDEKTCEYCEMEGLCRKQSWS
jgi:ATP-dependent helicase/nuclease subunit B